MSNENIKKLIDTSLIFSLRAICLWHLFRQKLLVCTTWATFWLFVLFFAFRTI